MGEKDISDFWYHNGKTRLWKSHDEWFWKVAKPLSPPIQMGMGGGQITFLGENN